MGHFVKESREIILAKGKSEFINKKVPAHYFFFFPVLLQISRSTTSWRLSRYGLFRILTDAEKLKALAAGYTESSFL